MSVCKRRGLASNIVAGSFDWIRMTTAWITLSIDQFTHLSNRIENGCIYVGDSLCIYVGDWDVYLCIYVFSYFPFGL